MPKRQRWRVVNNQYMTSYRNKRRTLAKQYLGGKCVVCGQTENLEFDHILPETKIDSIANLLTNSKETLFSELDKCQLLCHKHHIDKSKQEGSLSRSGGVYKEVTHGTLSGYDHYKCRCDKCKLAKKESRKKYGQ